MDIPVTPKPVTNTPWFTKFVECFFAGVAAMNGLFTLSAILLRAVLLKDLRLFINTRNRKDTARFRVSGYDGKKMRWDGIFNDDTVSMALSKAYSPQ